MRKFSKKNKMNFLTVFLVIDVVLVFSIIRTSSALYTSKTVGTADMDVALYAFSYGGMKEDGTSEQTLNFDLGSIKPGETKTYKFSVSNQDEKTGKVSDTSLRYDLKIITTNNLGLEYKLYKSNVLLTSSETRVIPDGYSTYFKHMAYPPRCMDYGDTVTIDEYKLEVYYPANLYKESKYQDMIESIKLQLVSKQMDSGYNCNGG